MQQRHRLIFVVEPLVTNSLESRFPDLASQWHPTRNGGVTPKRVGEIICVGGLGAKQAVEAGRRDEGAQAQDELARGKAQQAAAVGELAFHVVEDGAVGSFGETAKRERRAQTIAAKALERLAIVRVGGGAGVEREAVASCAARRQRVFHECGAAGRGLGRRHHLLRRRFVVGAVVEAAVTLEERDDSRDDAIEQRGDLVIARRVEGERPSESLGSGR